MGPTLGADARRLDCGRFDTHAYASSGRSRPTTHTYTPGPIAFACRAYPRAHGYAHGFAYIPGAHQHIGLTPHAPVGRVLCPHSLPHPYCPSHSYPFSFSYFHAYAQGDTSVYVDTEPDVYAHSRSAPSTT